MQSFSEYLNESKSIFKPNVDQWGNLWVTETTTIHNLDFGKSYITNKQSDDHYEQSTEKLANYSTKNLKAIKKKRGVAIYELPHYNTPTTGGNDVFDYNTKPAKKTYYSVASDKYTVITFFENKKEALMWYNTTV